MAFTFIIKSNGQSKNMKELNVKIINNLKIDSIYIDFLKKKKDSCYELIQNFKSDEFEIYDACFLNDSITLRIENKIVYQNRTKGKYSSFGSDLLYRKSKLDSIKFPIKVTIEYNDYNKKVRFLVPKNTKKVTIESYFFEEFKIDSIDDYTKVSYSMYTRLNYYKLLSCKKVRTSINF